MDVLISINKAAKMLGVAQGTLRNWDRTGMLKSVKTIGGHRRYRLSDLEKFQKGEMCLKD